MSFRTCLPTKAGLFRNLCPSITAGKAIAIIFVTMNHFSDAAELAANYVNTTNRHIFLTGKAGTGKTTFLRNIIRNTYKNAAVAAPTGIAAINAEGVTLHSLLQLPFGTFIPEDIPYTERNIQRSQVRSTKTKANQ